MKCAITGTGHVGEALAQQFARSGIAVTLANTRGQASITELAYFDGLLQTTEIRCVDECLSGGSVPNQTPAAPLV